MLNVIRSVNWDVYKAAYPRIDIPAALANLNSDEEAPRNNAFYDLSYLIEVSSRRVRETEYAFDLVHVLFKLLLLDEFRYKDYAGELLLICGQFTETNVDSWQKRLRQTLCEQLALNSSISENDMGKENKEYLESLCKNKR